MGRNSNTSDLFYQMNYFTLINDCDYVFSKPSYIYY